jgi:hypothetical protein
MLEEKDKKKTLSLEEIIQRAQDSEINRNFLISANYYFMIFTIHFDKIVTLKNINEIETKFIFSTILLPENNQKERMLLFLIQNEQLNIFKFKPLLEKFAKFQLVYMNDLNELLKICPKNYKNINFEKSLFEHNIYSLSKVFENISFDSAEKFFKMKIDLILNYTLKMIVEGKIKASIDEKRKFIILEKENSINLNFDKQIQNFCLKTKNLVEFIKSH